MPQDSIQLLIERIQTLIAVEVRLHTSAAELKPACERTAVQARANLELSLRAVLPRRAESTSRMQAVTVPITISIEDEGEKEKDKSP